MSPRAALLCPLATVLCVAVLSGCSSDESASTTTDGDRSTTTEAGDGTTTTEEDRTTTTATSGGASNAEWCTGMLGFLNTSSAGVFTQEQADMVTDLTEIAPDEVRDQMVVLRDGIVRVAELNTTDPAAAEAAFTELGPGSPYIDAVEAVYTWGQANCAPA